MESLEERKRERNERKQKAKRRAIDYCKKNNLSQEKLKGQILCDLEEKVYIAQRVESGAEEGLLKDLATQPIPTLVYDVATDTIEPTKDTIKYLL